MTDLGLNPMLNDSPGGTGKRNHPLDNLDRKCLGHFLSTQNKRNPVVNILDLGCGNGSAGLRLAFLRAVKVRVCFADRHIDDALRQTVKANADCMEGLFDDHDLNDHPQLKLSNSIDLMISRRFLHYLRYDNAVKVLRQISQKMAEGRRAYVSITALDGPMAEGYEGKGKSLSERFNYLALGVQNHYNMQQPVCLYDGNEFEHLFANCGFKALEMTRSPVGSLYGVFQKC